MMRPVWHGRKLGFLLMVSVAEAFLVGGCPGDRAMFFDVDAYVLDRDSRPLAGETLVVIPGQHYRWPRPQKTTANVTVADVAKYGETYRTDPNGLAEFVVGNDEPVEVLTSIFVDAFFPPSVKFLIMMPSKQPSAYAVAFVPRRGDYENDRVTYRHFDLKTARALPRSYSDASGGLDVAIHRPPRDSRNRWSDPHPSLHIRILTGSPPPGG